MIRRIHTYCLQILRISVYTETDMQREVHGRCTLYPGKADVQSIVENEATGNFVPSTTRMPAIREEHFPSASSDSKVDTAHLVTSDKLQGSPNAGVAPGRTLILGNHIRKAEIAVCTCIANRIAVSAEGGVRDSLRRVVRSYLHRNFELRELDYQPD